MTPRRDVIWHGSGGMIMLLVLLVVTVFVVPVVLQGDFVARLVVDVTLTLVLVGGTLALAESRGTTLALGVCVVVAAVIRWMPWAVPDLSMPLLREASTLGTLLLLAALVAMKVFAPGRVTVNRVFAAVVLYLLLGLSWALAYEMFAMTHAGAFSGATGESEDHVRWVYFSFVTLTTVGYGDITPVAPAARSLAILEALVGQLYPVVLLGRLVSLEAQDAPPAA